MNSFKTQKNGLKTRVPKKKTKSSVSSKRRPYINLTSDVIFQHFFKKDEVVLKSLLKAFLPLPKDKSIQKVQVLDSLSLPDQNIEDKFSIFDMKLKLNTGEKINVEMQGFYEKHLLKRVMFYLSRLYAEGLGKGEDYGQLPSSYSLVFTTVNVFKETQKFYSTFSMRSNQPPHFNMNDSLNVIFVELGKCQKREIERLFDLKEKWCYILKNAHIMSEKEMKKLSRKGEDMKTAVNRVKKLSKNEELRIIEEKREKGRWIDKYRIEYARDEGLEQGIEKGLEQGRKSERQAIAERLIQDKFKNTEIARLTGLTEKEVFRIRTKSKQ